MDQRVEITDEGSARAWLETQDDQTRVWFASRCALRALPALGEWSGATKSGLALATLRATLISASAGTCPPAEMTGFKNAADSAADSAARSVHSALSAASFDAHAPKTWHKLWSDVSQPESLSAGWAALQRQWDADDANWSFWIEWYEAILNGIPMPWELTHRIALEVTEAEWDAGQTVVAERIATIRLQFELEHEIANLKEQLTQRSSHPAHSRKHNNPPPLDDDPQLATDVVSKIWVEIAAIEDELAKEVKIPSKLQAAANALWEITKKIATYCGGKIDTTLEEAAKVVGSDGTKWAIRTGTATWIGMQEGTQTVAKMAWELAQRLASGG